MPTPATARPETGGSIVALGEVLIDIVRRTDGSVDENPGGSPANVALTLGRLGDRPTLIAKIADDARGSRIREWLNGSGVELHAIPAERTATATAHLDEDGAATYEFAIDWSLPADLDAGSSAILHTGSIAAFLHPGADAVQRIVEDARPRALITFDPNIRPSLLPDRTEARRRTEALVALADVVKASDEDLAWLYPGSDTLDAASAWQRSGPALVVVTQGGDGAVAVSESGITRVSGRPTQVVDTVGAGDTFMGALIHGLLRAGCSDASARERLRAITTEEVEGILNLAATAAAITVSRPGADPPRVDELPEHWR